MKHKILAAACALLLTVCPLTGCASSQSESDTITSDQFPYGATTAVNWSRNIPMAYDTRFLEDGLLDKLYDYYHSIETKDGDLLKSSVFPLYDEYLIESVYENKVTEQQIVDETNKAINEYFGYDFDFAYIEIADLVEKDGVSGTRDTLKQLLDDIAEKKGEKKVSEDTQHFYELTVTRHFAKKGSGTRAETPDVLTGEILYAIQYQNEWYVIFS